MAIEHPDSKNHRKLAFYGGFGTPDKISPCGDKLLILPGAKTAILSDGRFLVRPTRFELATFRVGVIRPSTLEP